MYSRAMRIFLELNSKMNRLLRSINSGPPCAERRFSMTQLLLVYFSVMRSKFKGSGRVPLTSNGKVFVLEPSKEKDTGFTSRKSFTVHSPLVTSTMRKPNRSSPCFSIAICLLLSFLFVLSTTGYYPSPHVFGLHDLVSRTFRIKGSDSKSSATTKLAVDPMSRAFGPESRARSSQVQFDKYSLILRGQRIFL